MVEVKRNTVWRANGSWTGNIDGAAIWRMHLQWQLIRAHSVYR